MRGQRVVLDEDLASIYGVSTKRLNEQIRRNLKRFPEDFVFQLSDQEVTDQADLKRRLLEIARRVAKGFSEHEEELREIRFLISELQKPEPPTKNRLGFG